MGLDSVEIVMKFESEFKIDISDPDAESMVTVGDAVQYVVRRLNVSPKNEATVSDVRERICRIVSEQMRIDRASISDSSRFYDDLGVT